MIPTSGMKLNFKNVCIKHEY